MCSSLVAAAAAAAGEGTSRDLQPKTEAVVFVPYGEEFTVYVCLPTTITTLLLLAYLKRKQYLSNICSLLVVLLISLKCRVVKKWNFFLRKKLIGKQIRNKMEALMEIVFTRLVMLFFMDRSVVQ